MISNHMCSSMGYPRTELPSKAYSDAKLDLLPFDVNHRLVVAFVVVVSRPESRSDPIGGSELVSGCETIYWDSLPEFFF